MMLIRMAQHEWLQEAGSCISGPTRITYNFFHFPTPVEIKIDGETIKTRPNACIFSEPMQPRSFYFAEDTKMNWIHAYPKIEPLLKEYRIPLNCIFYPNSTGFISEIFQKMMLERYMDDPYKNEMLDNYTREFLVKLSRSIHGNIVPGVSNAEQKKLHRVRWEVLSNLRKRWTVAEMAQIAALSPSRFHTVYKLTFGVSPLQDLVNHRVDMAKTMLLTDEYPSLIDVAEKLGYQNQYHFIRQFKNVTGMTPGAYRKKTEL